MALFNQVRNVMTNYVPKGISNAAEALVSIKRIEVKDFE